MIGNGDQSTRLGKGGQNTRSDEHVSAYLKILCNFANQALKGQFADKEFGGLLVTPNFTESDSSGPETMGLLYSTGSVLMNASSER